MHGYNDYEDAKLVELLYQGDHHAFETIYQRYWERLYRSAYGIFRDQEQVIDIVQEIFTSLWLKRGQVKIDNLSAYLYKAARFQVAKLIRHQKVRESFFDEVKALSMNGFDSHDPHDYQELVSKIEQGVESLPDRCREVFRLSRQEHLSNKEIAERMGISVRTVENQISRAMKRLRISASDYLVLCIIGLYL